MADNLQKQMQAGFTKSDLSIHKVLAEVRNLRASSTKGFLDINATIAGHTSAFDSRLNDQIRQSADNQCHVVTQITRLTTEVSSIKIRLDQHLEDQILKDVQDPTDVVHFIRQLPAPGEIIPPQP